MYKACLNVVKETVLVISVGKSFHKKGAFTHRSI